MLGSSIEEDFSVFLKETVSKAKNKKSLWFCYVIILNWYIFLFVFSFYFGPRFYFKHEYCMDSFNFLLLRTAGNTLVLFLLCTQLSLPELLRSNYSQGLLPALWLDIHF